MRKIRLEDKSDGTIYETPMKGYKKIIDIMNGILNTKYKPLYLLNELLEWGKPIHVINKTKCIISIEPVPEHEIEEYKKMTTQIKL